MQKSCCTEGILGGLNNALDMHGAFWAMLLEAVDRSNFSQLYVGVRDQHSSSDRRLQSRPIGQTQAGHHESIRPLIRVSPYNFTATASYVAGLMPCS